MAPRFCGSCGAALKSGGAFCGACGSTIAGLSLAAEVPAPVTLSAPGEGDGEPAVTVERSAPESAAIAEPPPDRPTTAPPPAPNAESTAGTDSGSVNQGLIAGVATAIFAVPAAIPGYFFAAWFFGDALSAIFGRHIRRTGGYDWLISSVGGFLVGAFATTVVGWLLLTYLFRRTDPTTYFRAGALGMLPVAAFWGTRGESGFSAAVWILFIWLGSLVGLWVSSDLSREDRESRK